MNDLGDTAFQRALDLLAGRNGQAMSPDEGAALLEQCARSGNAEAAVRAAVVAAAGFGRPLDWNAAMEWLVVAAERGHPDARAQVTLLAGAAPSSGEEDWRALCARIDLKAWAGPRPARLVFKLPRVGVAEGFLAPELCAWMIERARPLQKSARVYNPATGEPMVHDTRTNSAAAFTILELDLPMLLVRTRIANTLNVPVLFLERFSVFHYKPGQRFSRHVDFLDPREKQFAGDLARNGQRAATFLVYLNDGFEGGETHFMQIGKRLKGGVGDAVFFYNLDEDGRPDGMTVHEGAPPTSGEKWLLSQFIRDRPQLPG